jgi:hypothetical protein
VTADETDERLPAASFADTRCAWLEPSIRPESTKKGVGEEPTSTPSA